MESENPLSDEMLRAIDLSFPEDERARVAELLTTVGSDSDRVKILVLADGDFPSLESRVTWWHTIDQRDIWAAFQSLSYDDYARRCARMGLPRPLSQKERNAKCAFDQIATFVTQELVVSMERISPSTELQRDLGLAGDAGDRLIRAFATKFNVDLRGYDPGGYFVPVPGEHLLKDVRARLFAVRRAKIAQITIQDLIQSAETHRWKTGKEA